MMEEMIDVTTPFFYFFKNVIRLSPYLMVHQNKQILSIGQNINGNKYSIRIPPSHLIYTNEEEVFLC